MRSKSILVLVISFTVLCFGLLEANATVVFDNGEENTLDYLIDGFAYVYDGFLPGDPPVQTPTTVNVTTGGEVTAILIGYDNSQINVFDGLLNGLTGRDNSHINVFDGEIVELLAYNNSQVVFSGGVVNTGIWTYDDSHTEVTDGSIPSVLAANGNSTLDLSGGVIDSWIGAWSNSVITIYGSGFNYGYGSISVSSGHLTGTLANGDPLDNDFSIGGTSSIMLVPEPSTLLLLGLGGLMWRRRKRRA